MIIVLKPDEGSRLFVFVLYVHAHMPQSTCGDQKSASWFSLHHVSPGDGTQAIRLGNKYLYPGAISTIQAMNSWVGWLLDHCLRKRLGSWSALVWVSERGQRQPVLHNSVREASTAEENVETQGFVLGAPDWGVGTAAVSRAQEKPRWYQRPFCSSLMKGQAV